MTHITTKCRAAAVFALCAAALPAHAMLVLQSPEDFDGTGLGTVNTILTLQSPGNSTFEQGIVGFGDVITGNAKTGASQTQTLTFAEVGVTSASDIHVVFNLHLQPGRHRAVQHGGIHAGKRC